MKRKLCVACALVGEPSVVLLDSLGGPGSRVAAAALDGLRTRSRPSS